MTSLWQWLYDLPLSSSLRASIWAFPVLECIHIYSMVSLIALFVAFDFRLMGLALGRRQERQPISHLASVVFRWIWIPVFVNAVTGGLMFMQNAVSYAGNWAFRCKMLFILCGLLYHVPLLLKARRWDEHSETPRWIKVISVPSVVIWFAVIVASRWIAYT